MHIKRIWIPLLIAGVAGITYLGTECALSSSCMRTELMYDLSDKIFDPAFLYSLFILPAAVLILFVSQSAYAKWRMFTLWWLALSILILAAFETRTGGWMNPFPITRIDVTWFIGGLYLLISAILLAVQQLKSRK